MAEREPPRGYILGFDFGKRRIGVAVGQAQTGTATALEIVAHRDQPDWDAIARLIGEWKPGHIVVGLPLSEDGEETEMSSAARTFGNRINGRFNIPVSYHDERFTSQEAAGQFAEHRASGRARRKDAARLDAVAARLILENWLQSLPPQT